MLVSALQLCSCVVTSGGLLPSSSMFPKVMGIIIIKSLSSAKGGGEGAGGEECERRGGRKG
jgi:hypothetical protein